LAVGITLSLGQPIDVLDAFPLKSAPSGFFSWHHEDPQANKAFADTPADPDKIEQVLENLLKNGLEYTPEEGLVLFRLEDIDPGVTFSIETSGPGIAPEDLPFVFECFFRGEKSRSRDYGGTGIGLAIVKQLVEAHGGTVGVESGLGVTCFWFVLPSPSHPRAGGASGRPGPTS
jgi:signal transduction histidine kinase